MRQMRPRIRHSVVEAGKNWKVERATDVRDWEG